MDNQKSRLAQYRSPTYAATLSRASTTSMLTEKSRSSSREKHDDDVETLVHRSRSKNCSPVDSIFQWALKILGVASAIVFGVWAPVSYRLQQSGNKSSDDAQEKLIGRIEELVRRVEGVEKAMVALERLRAVEVCGEASRKTLPACQSLTSSLGLASILDELLSRPTHTTYTTYAPSSRRSVSMIRPTSTSTIAPSAPAQHDELDDTHEATTTPSSYLPEPTSVPQEGVEGVEGLGLDWFTMYGGAPVIVSLLVVCVVGWNLIKNMKRTREDEKRSGVRVPLLGG